MKVLVFNGWASGAEAWALCNFRHDWVFDYIEQLDGIPEKVIGESDAVMLVGFSMGGSTALRMLLKFPEKVKGMVLISTTPRMMENKDEGWSGMSERRLNALRLGTQTAFRDDPSPIYESVNLERGLEYLHRTDLRVELLARRDEFRGLPIGILQSAKDGIVRPTNAEFLRGIFPQARSVVVPGNEHMLPITVPGFVDKMVSDVLSVAVGPRG